MLRACAAERPEAIAISVGSRRSSGDRPATQLVAQRLAFDQFRRDVERAVDLLEREDRRDADSCVNAAAARASRASRSRCGGCAEVGRQRLQRDGAAEALVAGGVDHAHAAAADLASTRTRRSALPTSVVPSRRCRSAATSHAGRSRKPGVDSWRASSERTSSASSRSAPRCGREDARDLRRQFDAAVKERVDSAASVPSSRRRVALQLAREPGARNRPVTLDRRGRDAIASAVSSTRQPAEEPQLDEPCLFGVDGREPLERVVEREDVERSLAAGDSASSSVTRGCAPPRFSAPRARARSIRICRIECAAMAQKCARFCHAVLTILQQPQIRLVDEAGRLERLAGALPPQVAGGEPPQLLIDDRQQRVEFNAFLASPPSPGLPDCRPSLISRPARSSPCSSRPA